MGRPSLILVEHLEFQNDDNNKEKQEVSFRLVGQVQVDEEKDVAQPQED